jgi:hypothetical protein
MYSHPYRQGTVLYSIWKTPVPIKLDRSTLPKCFKWHESQTGANPIKNFGVNLLALFCKLGVGSRLGKKCAVMKRSSLQKSFIALAHRGSFSSTTLECRLINSDFFFCNQAREKNAEAQTGNPHLMGWLSSFDLLIRVACFAIWLLLLAILKQLIWTC